MTPSPPISERAAPNRQKAPSANQQRPVENETAHAIHQDGQILRNHDLRRKCSNKTVTSNALWRSFLRCFLTGGFWSPTDQIFFSAKSHAADDSRGCSPWKVGFAWVVGKSCQDLFLNFLVTHTLFEPWKRSQSVFRHLDFNVLNYHTIS